MNNKYLRVKPPFSYLLCIGVAILYYSSSRAEEIYRITTNPKNQSLFDHVNSSEVVKAGEKGFSDTTDFITYKDKTTFVPKDAILHLPDSFIDYINKSPTGEVILWNDFHKRNRNIVTPFVVTLKQAAGIDPIDPKLLDSEKKSGRIVVAVLRGCPTSVATNLR